jgi:hypothetical protein
MFPLDREYVEKFKERLEGRGLEEDLVIAVLARRAQPHLPSVERRIELGLQWCHQHCCGPIYYPVQSIHG